MKRYDTPPQQIFDEMKRIATEIWETYDNAHGYVTEKLNYINSFGNVSDNSMVFYRMFDIHNQQKFLAQSNIEILAYIKVNN